MKIWENIEERWDHPSTEDLEAFGPRKKAGREKLFEVREVERDASFLRRYLTEELIRELNLFEYKSRGNEQVVSRVADTYEVVGTDRTPWEYAEKTLKYVHQLWGRAVAMETLLDDRTTLLTFADGKFAVKKAA